jgi:protein-disulfide isomerase
MIKGTRGSKDPDIIASAAALRRAARLALQIGLETGTPVYVLEDGKIVDLTEQYRRKHKT